ncbi:MAG TPA: hypothetical protein VJR29_06055 [bacterium]|nr:hypothetical protein [bacterium]
MGPLLFLAVAGLALWGCSSALPPKSEPSAPPAPPDPECPESESSYGLARPPTCPPQARGSLSYFAKPSGQEAQELATYIKRIEPVSGFNPQEKVQVFGLSAALLEVANGPNRFFKNEYQNFFSETLRRVQDGKLRVNFAKPELPPGEYYDPALDELYLNPVLGAPITEETKIHWLGALFDLGRDGEGRPVARIAHAFERYTMQGLYLLESSGRKLEQMSEQELVDWQKTALQGFDEAPLLAAALTAFYYRSRNYEKRFAQLDIFSHLYEERLIQYHFKESYAQAAKDSPFHGSWAKITAEGYRPKSLPLDKIRADIAKLEKKRKNELDKLGQEMARLQAAADKENKKNDMIMREISAEERQIRGEVRKRFDTLIATWAKLSFLRDLEKSTRYVVKETIDIRQTDDEASRVLAKFSILGLEDVRFNGFR